MFLIYYYKQLSSGKLIAEFVIIPIILSKRDNQFIKKYNLNLPKLIFDIVDFSAVTNSTILQPELLQHEYSHRQEHRVPIFTILFCAQPKEIAMLQWASVMIIIQKR
jgi:hypothetical protein